MLGIAWAVLLLLLAGCRGHGNRPDEGTAGEFPEPPLDGNANPDEAALSGSISLSGLTLDGEGGHIASDAGGFTGSPGAGGIPPIGQPGIMARIVDPGDDILNSTFTDASGFYALSLGTTALVKLQVELRVVEDIDGDGTGGDTILQSVPVSLVQGKAAVVNLQFSLGSPLQADGSVFPEGGSGGLIITEMYQEDGNGTKNDFFGTLPGLGEMVFDRDGDHFLQRGPDPTYVDGDKNGWPDPSEMAYSDPAALPTELDGTISAVSIPELTMSLLLSDGSTKTIIIDPFTTIQQLSADGTYLGELTFDASLVGRSAHVSCLDTPAGVVAGMVVVLDTLLKR